MSSSPSNVTSDSPEQIPAQTRQAVPVNYEYSLTFPELLTRLNLSIVLSTYQAGRAVSLGVHQGELRVGFAYFDQAMGLTRTPMGIAVGSRQAFWNLAAHREIAPQIKPEGEHDIALLARSCHQTGPIMGHDLAFGGDRLWVVNTLFNCLATLEGNWSFVPQWKPPFMAKIEPGDHCHLNGVAMSETGQAPAYVTVLGETTTEGGWRKNKAQGGCLLEVPSGQEVFAVTVLPGYHNPALIGPNTDLDDAQSVWLVSSI